MNRRGFLSHAGKTLLLLAHAALPKPVSTEMKSAAHRSASDSGLITLFLCGDVMTGRGIDQVLPHPGDPRLYEPYLSSARQYVELAQRANGPIPKPVDFAYIWGDALGELERVGPDVRIINLETSVTKQHDYWRGKGINYRMHPDNIACITAAEINCCALANNHVLDWGYSGLTETLETLRRVNVKSAGAGRNSKEASAPAVLDLAGKGRVLVFSFGSQTSGIPRAWAASQHKPGVNLLEDFTDTTIQHIAERTREARKPGDIVVASIHWGGNWGYGVPLPQRRFAHGLVAQAGADIIHGHSSHHAKGIEVYEGKPIIYGCGDFLNDYEGIRGYEEFRADLSLMYFVTMNASTGKLVRLDMTPTQIRRFSVNRASKEDAHWLRDTLDRESEEYGTRVELEKDHRLTLRWG